MISAVGLTNFSGTLNVVRHPELQSITEGRYTVRLARDRGELESALRLRHQVFNVELGRGSADEIGFEFDSFDLKCLHLIVIHEPSGLTVGTYRLNAAKSTISIHGFYSASEFTIEDLPPEVLRDGIEVGRACVAKEHRNTKVLFLLWKGLLAYLEHSGKRYYFGCCSIFSTDPLVGRNAYDQLLRQGFVDPVLHVRPCRNAISLTGEGESSNEIQLPPLFHMYLRLGASVCSPPMIDRHFGTTDFFVVFDIERMNPKYRRLLG